MLAPPRPALRPASYSRRFFFSVAAHAQVAHPRADHAVAAAEMVIQEGERPALGRGDQPQRQLGQLHRQRVEIHAVDAPLDHPPAPRCRIAVHVWILPPAQVQHLHDEVGDDLGGVHQEMAAAHGHIANSEGQHLLLDEAQQLAINLALQPRPLGRIALGRDLGEPSLQPGHQSARSRSNPVRTVFLTM